jgi:hypothetical protein
MSGNLTSPRARWRHTDPMAAYDRLPPDVRLWLAGAALPWSAASVLRVWQCALRETGCARAAQARLSDAEARSLAREATLVWGEKYPSTGVSRPSIKSANTQRTSTAHGMFAAKARFSLVSEFRTDNAGAGIQRI